MTGWSQRYADGLRSIRWPQQKGTKMPKGNPAGYLPKGKAKGKGKMAAPAKGGAPMAKAAAVAAKQKKG
jgi:hypothetical protein